MLHQEKSPTEVGLFSWCIIDDSNRNFCQRQKRFEDEEQRRSYLLVSSSGRGASTTPFRAEEIIRHALALKRVPSESRGFFLGEISKTRTDKVALAPPFTSDRRGKRPVRRLGARTPVPYKARGALDEGASIKGGCRVF